jgi:DNA-binding transcriptional MerR regulator
MDRFLSPSETARRFGVTTKALRLYERHGLIAPVRSASGWRTYGPDQVARLVQILALKRLGLPLARIAELLAGRNDLDAVLALQEEALTRDSQKLSRALSLVRDARARLAAGAVLSIDDLANLAKETKMDSPLTGAQIKALLAPYTEKHLSGPQQTILERVRKARAPVVTAMERLYDEAAVLIASGNGPDSAPGLDLARRWRELASEFAAGVNGLQDIALKVQDAWAEAMTDPQVAPKLAKRQQVQNFIRDAWMHLRILEASFPGH